MPTRTHTASLTPAIAALMLVVLAVAYARNDMPDTSATVGACAWVTAAVAAAVHFWGAR